ARMVPPDLRDIFLERLAVELQGKPKPLGDGSVRRVAYNVARAITWPGGFHKTALNEFYRVAFRKKVYRSTDELQADLDAWIKEYNEARPHQGRWCFGKTPMQTFLDAMPMTKEACSLDVGPGHLYRYAGPVRRLLGPAIGVARAV